MKKIFLYFFISIIFFTSVCAEMSLSEQISMASNDVEEFLFDVDKQEIALIAGSKISVEDKLLFNIIKSQVPEAQSTGIIKDTQTDEIPDKKALVLIGSEKTNQISKQIKSQNYSLDNIENYGPLFIEYATLAEKRILMIYSEKENTMKENTAVKNSPLNKIVDEKYVPVVSTFLSVLMIYLWKIFGETIISLFKDLISSKILSKKSAGKKVEKKKVHKIKPQEFINHKEVIAFFVSVLIFTFTMSYTWSYDFRDFKYMFLLNLVIVFIISFARELIRLSLCYKQKLRSEYVLWSFGAAVTVLSTILGNTFSLVSYTLLDEDEADEKKFGKSSFLISLYTYLLLIISYILNIIKPSIWFQMIFVYCIMMLFIELFPIAPMPGQEIKEWNLKAWLISYVVVFISYAYLNFTIYL